MHRYYGDILERIAEPPRWFDEHAVPRFGEFSPKNIANIYAHECALVLIACQACGQRFQVAFSWHPWVSGVERTALSERITDLHFGDPPNMECCPAGPTMSSDALRVLEFWVHDGGWHRQPELEVTLSGETEP